MQGSVNQGHMLLAAVGMPPGGAPPGAMPPGGMPPAGAAPPGGGAMVPGAPGHPVQAQPPAGAPGGGAKKKSSLGLIIGIVVALLLVGGGAAAYLLLFSAPGPQLAKFVPKGVQVYAEIPSVPKAMVALYGVDPIDAEKLDPEKRLDDAVEGLAKAFKLSEEEARDVLTSVETMGMAVRDPHKGGEGVTLISFSSATGVDKLLESTRFDKDGEIGSGKKFQLEPREVEADDLEKMSPAEKMFSFSSVKREGQALVWFADENLLAVGDEELIEDIGDVIDKGKDSLDGSDAFKAAEFESGARAMVFVDSELLDEVDGDKNKELVDGFLSDVGPFTGSVRVVDAGIMMSASSTLQGDKVPDPEAYTAAVDLDLANRLPASTLAYFAMSTKSELSGKDAEKMLLRTVKDVDDDAAKQLEAGLDAFDEEAGFGYDTVHEALGDQGVMALVLSKKFKFDEDEFEEDELKKVAGFVYLQHVADKDAAEKIVKKLREKAEEGPLSEGWKVKKDGAGFSAKPEEDGMPQIEVKFLEDVLMVAVGGDKKIVKEITSAVVDGTETLADDAAHQTAISAFSGSPHLFAWADAGRIGKLILDGSKDIKKDLKKEDIPVDALVLTGENRITTAAAVRIEQNGESYTVHVDSLNGVALAPAVGFYYLWQLKSALKGLDDELKDIQEL